jgi:hypothetical protein
MKQVAGLPNSVGTRMIVLALYRVHSSLFGAIEAEHMRMRAVSIASFEKSLVMVKTLQ